MPNAWPSPTHDDRAHRRICECVSIVPQRHTHSRTCTHMGGWECARPIIVHAMAKFLRDLGRLYGLVVCMCKCVCFLVHDCASASSARSRALTHEAADDIDLCTDLATYICAQPIDGTFTRCGSCVCVWFVGKARHLCDCGPLTGLGISVGLVKSYSVSAK